MVMHIQHHQQPQQWEYFCTHFVDARERKVENFFKSLFIEHSYESGGIPSTICNSPFFAQLINIRT